MSSRICVVCFNKVSFSAFNTVFACPHCQSEIFFGNDDPYMSKSALKLNAESLQASSQTPSPLNARDLETSSLVIEPESVDTLGLDSEAPYSINTKALDLGKDVTVFDGGEAPKETFKGEKFAPAPKGGSALDKRENGDESVFDVESSFDAPAQTSRKGDAYQDVELLVRDSVGEVKELKRVSRRKRARGFYFLLMSIGVAIGGLLLTLLFFHYQKSAQDDISEAFALKDISDKDHEVYNQMFDASSAQSVLEKFLEASSSKKALRYILPDKTIKTSVKKYWKPVKYSSIKAINAIPIRKHAGQIYYFECTNDDLNVKHIYPVIVSKWQKAPLVDWRFPNQIQDMPISEAIKTRRRGKVSVRCGITVEDYYNYRFMDRDEWQSFSCWDTIHYTDSKLNRIDAYVKRGSKLHDELLQQLYQQSGFIAKQESLIHVNTQIELLNNEPVGLEKIRLTNTLPPYKGNANVILELDIVDPYKNIALITKIISAKVVDYYEEYQLPYVAKRK